MINLLPYEQKEEIRSGRTNVLLVRYIIMMVLGMLLIAFLVVGMYFTLNVSAADARKRITENEQRASDYASAKKAAETFRSDLMIAKTILSNDVRYSSLIYKISAALPSGVVLNSLSVDSQTLGTSVTISASATSYSAALSLKKSFESKTDLFSDVHFATITHNEDTTTKYAYETTLNVIMKKDAL